MPRRLVDVPHALAEVARKALQLCHFDPDTGADLHEGPDAPPEPCEAACYDCLMSYTNQPDHKRLDRKQLRDLLLRLADAKVASAPGPITRPEHLERLKRVAASDLERRFVDFLEARSLTLPDRAGVLFEVASTRPDFVYDAQNAVVYVDGPVHEFPTRQQRDAQQQTRLEDAGYSVIRFAHDDDWPAVVARYPWVFGKPSR